MKVELIGTGAIYTKYNSACTLINENMIVDMPNGTLKQLLKKNYEPERIRTILITHMHGDHIADLPFFLKYVYGFNESNNETVVIGPKGIKDKIVQLFEAYNFEDREEIEQKMNIKYREIELKEEVLKEVNQYRVQALLVSHGEEKPAYGYIINNSLGITGDTTICEAVETIVKDSKITIADTSLTKGGSCHMGIDNINYLTKKYKKQIVATHLRDTTRKELNRLKLENILVKEDGEVIEL